MNDTTNLEYYRKLSNDLQRKVSDLREENASLDFACTMHLQEMARLNKENERLRANDGMMQHEIERLNALVARLERRGLVVDNR